MPKKIALDWDAGELRYVIGRTSAAGVAVSELGVVTLDRESDLSVARQVAQVLRDRGWNRLPQLVVLGRGKAEMRALQLPPVPDEELPDMIRFQAVRDFAGSGDRATVDFVEVERNEQGVRVLAAAIGPEQFKAIDGLAGDGGSVAQRIGLRPLAAAALYAKHESSDQDVVLVDLLARDADISILRHGKAAFARSVRLPDNPEGRPVALAGEVRRSIMAASTGAGETSLRKIVIWGRGDVHAQDVQELSKRIGVAVETLDPLTLVSSEVGNEQVPEHIGRFAPLIGLLEIDEAGSDLLIDFRNPRKPPDPPNHRDRLLLYGGSAIAAALLVGFSVWSSLSKRDDRIAELRAKLDATSDLVELSQTEIDRTEQVEQFLDGNVIWLEELRRVAEKAPTSDKLILSRVNANLPARSGAELVMAGRVTEPAVVDQLRDSMQDTDHRAIRQGANEAAGNDLYGWSFSNLRVVIEPRVVRAARKAKRAAGNAPAEQTDSGTQTAAGQSTVEEAVADPPPDEIDGDRGTEIEPADASEQAVETEPAGDANPAAPGASSAGEPKPAGSDKPAGSEEPAGREVTQ